MLISAAFVMCAYAKKKPLVLDTTKVVAYYDEAWTFDTLKKEVRKDLIMLEVGNKISKSVSYYSAQMDSLKSTAKGRKYMDQVNSAAWARRDFEGGFHYRSHCYIYKDYPEVGKMKVTDFIMVADFTYEDSMNAQQWVIRDSTKEIKGIQAQLAECDFRGRHWIAWFAPSIAIMNGPWKFSGLPGLILDVEDSKKEYVFKFSGLKNIHRPIVFSNPRDSKTFEPTTRLKFLQQYAETWLHHSHSKLVEATGIDLGDKDHDAHYDLIEKDY